MESGDHAGARTCGENDKLRIEDSRFAISFSDFHLAWALVFSVTFDPLHLVLLHQAFDAFRVFGHNLILAVGDGGIVKPGIVAENTLIRRVREIIPYIGRMQQRFGGNAAYMQASSAKLRIPFDDGCFQAELAGADRCGVAAGAATNDYQIIRHLISLS